jgi:hypothetical protein
VPPSNQVGKLCPCAHGFECVDGRCAEQIPSGRGWTLVQHAGIANSQDLDIAPTGAGHVLFVGLQCFKMGNVQISDNAPDGGNTYTLVPGGIAPQCAELWIATQSKAGATSISGVGDCSSAVVAWEVAGLSTTAPLDVAGQFTNQPISATPLGAAVTTTHPGDFVLSILIGAETVTGLHAGDAFTNDELANGNGWAHLTSNAAPPGRYQAEWDQDRAGSSCGVTAAFKAD